jgi:serine phosphatase RsbU (regulator of sigma subunit)
MIPADSHFGIFNFISLAAMNLWSTISNVGSNKLQNPKDHRELTLLNRIVAIATFNLSCFIPIGLYFGLYDVAVYVFIGILLSLATLLLSHLGYFKFARQYYLIVAVMFVTFLLVALSGRTGGSQIVFILLVTLQLVLFREPARALWVFAIMMMVFALGSFWAENTTSVLDNLDPAIRPMMQRLSFYLNVISCMTLVFAVVYYFRNTAYAYEKTITEQNAKISQKNKEITDSINYAKRIQEAKLPKIPELATLLPQSFILFKPKDIVSGDFYFFKKQDEAVLIAAADCTGHGVPGAFMSLIGMEKLAEATTMSSAPAEILGHLNKGIKQSLNQTNTDESTRDGMDISLCAINPSDRTLSYSGANRPLWIIRPKATSTGSAGGSGHYELEEIKPTKAAIGGLTKNDQAFGRNDIVLEPGATFYIFSDGYADQFSGISGKKLMTKKLKEILVSIQAKSMAEQRTYLDDFIEEWKSGSEQLDDILIIGVRL